MSTDSKPFPLRCVLCDSIAITTVAHIPVCEAHSKAYHREAQHDRTDRPFYDRLVEAAMSSDTKPFPPRCDKCGAVIVPADHVCKAPAEPGWFAHLRSAVGSWKPEQAEKH